MAMAQQGECGRRCRRLKAGCFRSTASSTQRYPRFHRLSTGDNDGLAREDLDLGRDARKGLCASRGAYFKPGGGIGGLATNEKAMKARGCVRGRERDGPRSDWNIQQAETRKRRDKSGDDLSGATLECARSSNVHAGNELNVAK